jgi:phosphohistidine swiveling domain-containing protein
MKNSSKISALLKLKKKNKNKNFLIPDFIFFKKREFLNNKEIIFKKILNKFHGKKIILRSASLNEDGLKESNAGKFKSFSNLDIKKEIILKKIEIICNDFKNDNDQIIVQLFLKEAFLSGVVFTRDPETNAPYYVINYDKSGKTDLITSGKINPTSKTLIIYKNFKRIPLKFNLLVQSFKEIEKIYGSDRIDIEFAISKKNKKIYIFQCRPVYPLIKKNYKLDEEIEIGLNNIKKKINKLKAKNLYLPGDTTCFSNMSDWNPAEMIGIKPSPLSFSLYSELITDSVWSNQRSNYGYQNVSPNKLMINLGGSPYIDLRVDFNSFLPKNLNNKLKDKIIKTYLKKIIREPDNHDKIEFNIVPTFYTYIENQNLGELNSKEQKIYNNELKKISENIYTNYRKILNKESNLIKKLIINLNKINKSKLSHIQKIYFLVHECKSLGTLPFAGIARTAFMNTMILNLLLKYNLISMSQKQFFFHKLNTISKKVLFDFNKYKKKKITKKQFCEKYGHLRPQSYSVESKSYNEAFEEYFTNNKVYKNIKIKKDNFTNLQNIKIKKFLLKKKFPVSFKELINFTKHSIEMRELSKFHFTKILNEIFNQIKKLAEEVGIKYYDFKFIPIQTLLDAYNNLSLRKLKSILVTEIKKNKETIHLSNSIKLPDFINKSDDIYLFFLTNNTGNFVTNKICTGKVIEYKKNKKKINYEDCIVLIENADPGFDFLFSHNIKGFISKYGGANSHMSIRCLELGIPAIIGVGQKNYDDIKKFKFIQFDCKQKILKKI